MSVFQHSKRLVTAGIGIIVLLGCLSRFLSSWGELWLDEMWSVVQVSTISSPIQIVTSLLHDNNHPLNSLWIYLAGVTAPPWVLRAPAVACGALLLALILAAAPRLFGQTTGLLFSMLCAGSYFLVLYGSEARGYSLMLLCAVACFFIAIDHTHARRSLLSPKQSAPLFAASGILGCLAHGAFALFLASFFAWIFYVYYRGRSSDEVDLSHHWLRRSCLPVIIVGSLLSLAFYARLEIGGAPIIPYLQVLISTVAVALGLGELSSFDPAGSTWTFFTVVVTLSIALLELRLWVKEDAPTGTLVILILAIPCLAVAILQPPFILSRYFIVQVVMLYLVLARFMCRLAQQGTLGTGIAVTALILWMWSNVTLNAALIQGGRSHFLDMLDHVSLADNPTLGSDQDFQTAVRLRYAQLLPSTRKKIEYIPRYRETSPLPAFILRERIDLKEIFPRSFETTSGATYTLVRSYPATPLSGASAALYQQQAKVME